jgi:hypothetical protein
MVQESKQARLSHSKFHSIAESVFLYVQCGEITTQINRSYHKICQQIWPVYHGCVTASSVRSVRSCAVLSAQSFYLQREWKVSGDSGICN